MGSSPAATSDEQQRRVRAVARELYAVPRAAFVGTRTERAKALREAGDRDLAALVLKLPKPTLQAWAIDRAVIAHPDEVERLLETISKMQSPESAADLRVLAAQHEQLVERLARAADDAAGGGRVSDLAAAIRTVALSGDAQAFVDGTLAKIPSASDASLEAALAAGAALAPKERSASRTRRSATAKRHDVAERRRTLRSELASARALHRDAARALRDAERAVEQAELDVTEASERIAELEAQLAQLD